MTRAVLRALCPVLGDSPWPVRALTTAWMSGSCTVSGYGAVMCSSP